MANGDIEIKVEVELDKKKIIDDCIGGLEFIKMAIIEKQRQSPHYKNALTIDHLDRAINLQEQVKEDLEK